MALARRCVRLVSYSSRVITWPAATPFPSTTRHLGSSTTRHFNTSTTMSKEQIEELQKNPFFDKYADKIAKLQKTSPEEFLTRLAAQEEAKKPKVVKPKDFSLPTEPKAARAMGASGEKTLDKVMKVELLRERSGEEVAAIWTEYWLHRDAVSAAIPAATYQEMRQRFQEFPVFLLPLPRDQGYEFIMVQFKGDEAHFSTLINYQAHQENAPECLGLVHYAELAGEKGLVLMAGEYDTNILSPKEAKYLVDMLEIYYAKPSESKLKLLQKFTNTPALFNHMELIDEINSIELEGSQLN